FFLIGQCYILKSPFQTKRALTYFETHILYLCCLEFMKEGIRKGNIFWLFYKKLIIHSLILSFLTGLMSTINSNSYYLTSIGTAYIFITPAFHYLTYELRNKNEYYFYLNQGFSKGTLWILTCAVSFSIGLIFILL